MRKIAIIFVLLILVTPIFAEEIDFSPSAIGEMEVQVKVFGEGSINGLEIGQQAKMQILTFQKSAFQEIEIVRESVFINDKTIPANHTFDEFNNKYAEFVIPENGSFRYELIANITTTSLIHNIEDYNLSEGIVVGGNYLEPSEKVESDSSEIATLSANKFTKDSFLETLNDTVSWVNDYVEYARDSDFQKYYLLQQSALETLRDKKGVCDEFANLGTAILRAKGIPTRLAIGITFDGRDWGNHAWIEVYQPKIGWIPSDPTFRESGFVDATHIKMGAFSDVSLSLAKAIFPSNASVSFNPPTLPEVVIIDKQYFDAVELDLKAPSMEAKNWNELVVSVTNKTNSDLMAPVSFNENYQELYLKVSRQDVRLGPGETKDVIFEIYPDVELTSGQVATGDGLRVSSLSTPVEMEFEIKYSSEEDAGTVEVIDITPIVSGDDLEIEVTASNYSPEDATITIKISNGNTVLEEDVTLESFTLMNRITKKISSFKEEDYTVEVTTQSAKYTQNVNPVKIEASNIVVEDQNQGITQQVDTTQANNNFSIDLSLENPIVILMLVVLLMVMALVTAYYFSQKTRYI